MSMSSQQPSPSTGAVPSAAQAVEDCQAQADGKTYTGVIDAESITMDRLRSWYKNRNPGIYSPSQIAAVPAEGSVTVCEMEAPGIAVSRPALPSNNGQTSADTETPAALLLLGLDKAGPVLDTASTKQDPFWIPPAPRKQSRTS